MEHGDIGPRIRALRLNAGITQEAASRHAGVTRQRWTAWENGHGQPQAHRLGNIARAINAPVSALFAPDDCLALADVIITQAAITRARTQGQPAIQALTRALTQQLAPLVANACAEPTVQAPAPRARRTYTKRKPPARKRLEA